MVDLKNKLNPSQFEAVTTTEGPVLVIAGAGSGKTRAIEYRVLHLVESDVKPESILLLTFTRRASHEMLSRAERHDNRCKHVDGGTFHSFAYKTLKKYAKKIGFHDSFSILDEGDAADAVHKCALRLNLFDKEKRFPKKDTLRSVFSMATNKRMKVSHILEKEYPHFADYADEIETLRKEYARYKVQKNYLDYDDLLLYTKLLLDNEDMRRRIAGRYRYVMVDEYQDTNMLQAEIATALAKDHRNIMVVGDDAQSIYSFRGASHENIMEFPRLFSGCKVIKLEENYRSTQAILDVANAALSEMEHKYSKCLFSARGEVGQRPRLVIFRDIYEEAAWIVGRIKELHDADVPLHKTAVLFRSAYVSIPIQAELSRKNIPFQVFGGIKFYETAHVKDCLAHLKVISNPKDELSWHRILTLIEGVGPKTGDMLAEKILARPSIRDIIEHVFAGYRTGYKFSRTLQRLAAYLKRASSEALSPGEQYDLAVDYYTPFMKEKFDDWHIRINDFEALKQISSRYASLAQLLADFTIEPPDRGVFEIEPHTRDEKPLVLSTIHSAKGLEWENVFLIGCADGTLPISFALGCDEDIEEENRLFYVAITRAKNSLILSMHHEASRGGLAQFNKISRFVDSPGMLGHLTQDVVVGDGADGRTVDSEDGVKTVYDKDALLEDIIDSFS